MLRPISVTPILARIFERLVYDQFVSNSYNLWLNKNQFGFRNKSSTSCALIKLMDYCKSLEKQGCDYIRIFSLDLSKAFGRVPHHLIISQLSKVVPSVNPYIVNLIRSFLMHWKQFVVYDNQRSSTSSTNSGVPQGTVMGPPCFNLSYDDCQVTQTLALNSRHHVHR